MDDFDLGICSVMTPPPLVDEDSCSPASPCRKRMRHVDHRHGDNVQETPASSSRACTSFSPDQSRYSVHATLPLSPVSPRSDTDRDNLRDGTSKQQDSELVDDCDMSRCTLSPNDEAELELVDDEGFPPIHLDQQLWIDHFTPLTPPGDWSYRVASATITRQLQPFGSSGAAAASTPARGGYVFGSRGGHGHSGWAANSLRNRSDRGVAGSGIGHGLQQGSSSNSGGSFSNAFAARLTIDPSALSALPGPYNRRTRTKSAKKEKYRDMSRAISEMTQSLSPSLRASRRLFSQNQSLISRRTTPPPPPPHSHSHYSLPNESWTAILSYLDAISLAKIASTSVRFSYLGSDQLLWLSLCKYASMPITALPFMYPDIIFDTSNPVPMHISGPWMPRLSPCEPRIDSTPVWSWRRAHAIRLRARQSCLASSFNFTHIHKAHKLGVTSLAVSACGLLITGSWDGFVKAWRVVRRFHDVKHMAVDESENLNSQGSRWWGGAALGDDLTNPIFGGDPAFVDCISGDLDGDEAERRTGKGAYDLELAYTIRSSGPVEFVIVYNDLIITAGRSARTGNGECNTYRLCDGTHLRSNNVPETSSLSSIATDGESVTASSKEYGLITWPGPIAINLSSPASHLHDRDTQITSIHILRPHVSIATDARGHIKIYNTFTNAVLAVLPVPFGLLSSTLSTTSRDTFSLLCGYKDGFLRRYDAWVSDDGSSATLEATKESPLTSLSDWIACVSEEPMCGLVYAGSWDGRVRIWDTRKAIDGSGGGEDGGRLRRTLVSDVKSAILSIGRLEVDGEWVLVGGCYDGGLVLWDFVSA